MAAFTSFFVNSVAFTSQQRATQVAIQIANSTIQGIRALPAADLVAGRATDGVGAQFASMSQATDSGRPTTAPSAAVKTLEGPQKVNNIDYGVDIEAAECEILTQDSICARAVGDTGIAYIRADVVVTWTGARCPSNGCTYVTSTLLSTADDPTFNVNESTPVSFVDPLVANWAVGDPVNLAIIRSNPQPFRVVINTGTLPAGLALNTATGVISGSPTVIVNRPSTCAASTSSIAVCSALPGVSLKLTDSFGRVTYSSFTWTMQAALTTTAPAAQASFIGTAVTLTLPAVSGGIPGYQWSDPALTLPPGLALSTVDNATITGTPTVRGVFPVTLTVTDSLGGTSRVSFSWTTDYPPMVAANPGSTDNSTVGTADSVTMIVTGGSGSFAWSSSAALPAGLTLSNAGVVSGIPTTAGATSVALLVTDTTAGTRQNVAFSWTVYEQPKVTSPGNQPGPSVRRYQCNWRPATRTHPAAMR